MRLCISGQCASSLSTSTSKNMNRDLFGHDFVGEVVADAGGVGFATLMLVLVPACERGSLISPRFRVIRPVIPASSHASPRECEK